MNDSSHYLTFVQSQQLHWGTEENRTNSQRGLRFKASLEHYHHHLFDKFPKHKVEVQYTKAEIMGLILQTHTDGWCCTDLCCLLSAPSKSVVHADSCRNYEHYPQHHIIPRVKSYCIIFRHYCHNPENIRLVAIQFHKSMNYWQK